MSLSFCGEYAQYLKDLASSKLYVASEFLHFPWIVRITPKPHKYLFYIVFKLKAHLFVQNTDLIGLRVPMQSLSA